MKNSHTATITILILLVILSLPNVKAGFACGIVNTTQDLEPQWMQIQIYNNNKEKYATCTVSPDQNKFCCDTEEIPGFTWKLAEEIKAEIYSTTYYSEPVSLQITGQGYDVFPTIQPKKAITLHEFSKITVGNKTYLNASFQEPYTHIEIEKNKIREQLPSGNYYYEELTAEYGMNYLRLIASGQGREFIEDLTFALLKYIHFNRTITCDKCKNNLIKTNQETEITLHLDLSNYVEGMELKEYVPKDFEITSLEGGEIKDYSQTHNLITWNVNGSRVIKSYKVKAPNIWFFPKKYTFRTELENQLLEENEIIVSRFFSFWTFEEELEFKETKRKTYSRISPQTPLVLNMKNEITKMGIIPKKTIKNAELKVEEYQGTEELENTIGYYILDTNIALEDIDKIFVEFKINKSSENLSLYVFEEEWQEWDISEIDKTREDELFVYYQTYIAPTKKIALVKEEKSFWDFLKLF